MKPVIRPTETHGEDMPTWQLLATGFFGICIGASMLWWGVPYAYEKLQHELIEPLINGGAVIYLSRSDLVMPGIAIAAIPIIFFGVVMIRHCLFPHFQTKLFKTLTLNATRALLFALVVMIVVPLIAGAFFARQIKAKGYVECPKLFDFGVVKLVHGYVRHPMLCVSKDQIREATALYQRLLEDEKFRNVIERSQKANQDTSDQQAPDRK